MTLKNIGCAPLKEGPFSKINTRDAPEDRAAAAAVRPAKPEPITMTSQWELTIVFSGIKPDVIAGNIFGVPLPSTKIDQSKAFRRERLWVNTESEFSISIAPGIFDVAILFESNTSSHR